MPVIGIVVITIDTINAVILFFYTNIRLYPLALSTIKLKLTLPLLLLGIILYVVTCSYVVVT